MKATSAPLDGNKVRLTVEVDEPEVERVLAEAVRTIGRQLRVPGFRPGRVPRQVLEARVGGAAALRAEALREAIPEFYSRALSDTQVDPIAPPEVDITSGAESGSFSFDAIVAVRPVVAIPGYAGLSVTVPRVEVSDEEVDAQLDRMRETEAELVDVERPAADHDVVTIDLQPISAPEGEPGPDAGGLVDFSYEVGSERLVPGLDHQVRGARPGDVFEVDAEPDRGSAEPGAEVGPGTPAIVRRFRVLVKAVREKQLPALTDEWAAESSEFVTVDELRDELRSRIAAVKRERTTMMARQRSLEALAELVVDDEIPSILVQDEVERRVHDLSHRLEEQGIGFERFLQMTGRTGEDLVTQIRSESHAMVKVDLALRALAEAEGIEVSDEAITDRIDAMASSLGTEARKLRRQLEDSGRIVALRSELRKELASEWLFDHVELFDENGIEVPRDALAQEDAGTLEAVGGGASTDVSLEPGKGDGQ